MSRYVDLDERLAIARNEAGISDEPPSMFFRGRLWELPPDLPVDFLEQLNRPGTEGVLSAIASVLGLDVHALDPRLGLREAQALAEALPELYGLTAGESGASPESSPTGGTNARPTLRATTASTYRRPSR